MFDISFNMVLECIKCLGWFIPVYIVLGFLGDMVKGGSR